MATVGVKHSKVVTIPDDPNYPVGSDEWNDFHTVTGLENVDNTSDVNKPVSTAQAAADALKANIASPTFTGVPAAPTAAPGTNTTQLSTTAFVQAAVTALIAGAPGALDTLKELADAINDDASFAATITTALALKAPLASPTFTGTPAAPTAAAGNSTTQLATTAFVAANAVEFSGAQSLSTAQQAQARANIGVLPAPQGRLTLQTGTPVMTTTQSAKTTLFYSAYAGNQVPIYDGTQMWPKVITGGEISALTTDATKSPAAIGASKVNDWFVWDDAGTIRLSHGPDWTSDTARSAGTALVMVNGILLNNAAITNGPAASRGTYVGTTRSNASSQLDWILGTSAAGGGQAWLGVWNAYNRVSVVTRVVDSTTLYSYGSATVRNANASAANRVSFVSGLAEDGIYIFYGTLLVGPATQGAFGVFGFGLDSTTVMDKRAFLMCQSAFAANVSAVAAHTYDPQLGFHFVQAMEVTDGSVWTYNGNVIYNGLQSLMRM